MTFDNALRMYSQCWIYSFLILFVNANPSIVLHIGALFDFEHPSNDNGRQDLRAAQLAIDEINTRRIDLFDGRYTLQLLANNSQVKSNQRSTPIFIFFSDHLV